MNSYWTIVNIIDKTNCEKFCIVNSRSFLCSLTRLTPLTPMAFELREYYRMLKLSLGVVVPVNTVLQNKKLRKS